MLVIQNINMFTFKHPKYYKELRARNKSDQAISKDASTEATSVRPDPGPKQQAASDSQVVNQVKLSSQSQATSSKHQASSVKHQAQKKTSHKPQAPSSKLQA
jgi:hypothetical protein